MLDFKPTPIHLQSSLFLSTTCTTPTVDSTLYRHLVGSLMYMTHTSSDILFVVGLVFLFSHDHHDDHWKDAKCILTYIWN